MVKKRTKTAVKVGQVMTLSKRDNESLGLRVWPDLEARREFWLAHPRVRVVTISFGRRDLKANSVWLEVEAINDPTKRGWIPFDCGGWDQGLHLKIDRLTFEEPEKKPVMKDGISCS
jgi:hypothetical protein